MDERQMLIDTVEALAASGIDPDKPFTEAVFAPIAKKYEFNSDGIFMARLLLNIAVVQSSNEAQWTATNLRKVRKKLEAVEKRSLALRESLQELDEEDLYVINQTAIAHVHATDPEVMELIGKPPVEPTPTVTWDRQETVLQRPEHDPLPLSQLTGTLAALEQAMEASQRMAGKSKTGRREDATLEPLLVTAYQVYENFTDKRFTLDWHGNDPLSEAAEYCVAIVRAFDGKIPNSKIVSAADAIRTKSFKVSSLEEVPDFVKHYSKRSR